jgi:formate-dependent nitrite reductase cytochrome c552 subunit
MRYAIAALAAAVLAFFTATLLPVRPAGQIADLPATGPLDRRFPVEAKAFAEPAQRGHALSLKDRDEADPEGDPRWTRILAGRPKRRPQPASCATCHASVAQAGKPLGCPDCHDPATAALRLTRNSPARSGTYDERRTALCAQCHHRYDVEWKHAETGARVLEPRHPQFELWREGPHARAGASCADCHMPLVRRAALRVANHHARSPLEMLDAACARCHPLPAVELRARIRTIQDRTRNLAARAAAALVAALDAIHDAQASGNRCDKALEFQTEAQWRLEYVANDRSLGFHAPQESARLLAEAIDYARLAQLEATR